MDIANLSLAELQELQNRIPQEMKRRESQKKTDVLNEIRAIAKAHGFALEDLLKEAAAPKVRGASGTVRVKYRHPDNAELQWTGRGRKPKWVEAWLANGGSLDSLTV